MAYQIRSGALEGFEPLVRRLGQNPLDLLRRVGLGPGVLRDPETLIPYARMAELLELAAERCDDDCFGIQLGVQQGLNTIGPLGLTVAQQPTLQHCLRNSARYAYLHAHGAELSLVDLDDSALLHFAIQLPIDFTPVQLLDTSVGLIYRMMETLNGGRSLAKRVLVKRSAAADTARRYRDLLQCDVRFSQSQIGFIMNPADLRRSPRVDQSLVQEYVQRNIMLMEQRYPEALPQQVKHGIRQLLPTGECSVASVASLLGLHPRTLQQRLKAEGSGFRILLAGVRKELAIDYLRFSKLDITEIALMLGFAEASVFSRVFRDWTGCSPRAFRQAAR